MKDAITYYNVGPLLYCPATNANIAHSIVSGRFGQHFSLALCLEDTIADHYILEAEDQMVRSLNAIQAALEKKSFYLPQIFVRVRDSVQINRIMDKLGTATEILSGFILSKFAPDNANAYLDATASLNKGSQQFYIMPVLESPSIVNLQTRYQVLYDLKNRLDTLSASVLNIRVGGNDLCNVFGLRRQVHETIYDIRPVADLLSDIVTVFQQDYVISGPVWEYYNGPEWQNGLKQELLKDKAFGFVGKTVIHPRQISMVNQAFAVSSEDYSDAVAILEWDPSQPSMISGSIRKVRMNECKTHRNWAVRTKYLADSYGLCE